jgi:hypothetical protein
MVIKFNIPNGRMAINADTFFREAGKLQIRKMLKLLSRSGPYESQVQEMSKWLEEQIQREKSEAARGSSVSRKLAEKYGCILGYADKLLS